MASGPTTTTDEHSPRPATPEHEIRDMISTLTRHLTSIGECSAARPPSSGRRREAAGGQADNRGVRIVTLAGENKGATMRAEHGAHEVITKTHGVLFGDEKKMSAFANSNYQGVNNSVLFEGRCVVDDPGVHVVLVESLEEDGGGDVKEGGKEKKRGSSGKKQDLEW